MAVTGIEIGVGPGWIRPPRDKSLQRRFGAYGGKKRADSFKASSPFPASRFSRCRAGLPLECVVWRTLNGIGLAPVNTRDSSARWDFSFGIRTTYTYASRRFLEQFARVDRVMCERIHGGNSNRNLTPNTFAPIGILSHIKLI